MHRYLCAGLSAIALFSPQLAAAHAILGNRFFPATLIVDDPFVADEAALPTVSTHTESASDEGPKTRETEISYEFAKRLTPHFGLSMEHGLCLARSCW